MSWLMNIFGHFTTTQYIILVVIIVLIVIRVFGEMKDFDILIILLALFFFLSNASWIGLHKDSKQSDIFNEIMDIK